MNTNDIMQLALEMANLQAVPGDSAIYHPGKEIGRVLIGIDIDGPEVILAHNLGYDLAISHHPMGDEAVLDFHHVLERHVEQMVAAGVPERLAKNVISDTIRSRRILDSIRNYDRASSIARLLDMPYMNIHTPLDEIGRRRMSEAVSQLDKQDTVNDLIILFQDHFAEFRNAKTKIEVMVGRQENHLGRTVISHAAGTNGGYPVAKAYFDHGVDTVVYIHCRPDSDLKRLQREYQGTMKNLIVTGHIASDSLGINPFINRLEECGLEVTPISGIISPS